jgi:nucleoside-diphosphate-sugar epimerase
MKILLTGASGFTGRYFERAAAAVGHEVVALQANLSDSTGLTSEVAGVAPQAVVHLGAISFVGHADDGAFYAVNTVGTTNLLRALARLPKQPHKVLLASSANVYGNCPTSPISEAQTPAPVNHYAMSKLAMEHMAGTFADSLPIVITRPFNYTGPGQALNFVIPKLVSHYARRAPMVELGNIQVEREFNDVRMVCDAYLALLAYGQPGEVFNVCSGQPYTLQTVMETLAELTGHFVQAQVNPAFVRANEVQRLCGDAGKLHALCQRAGVQLQQPSLRDMLAWMLNEASA